MIAKSVLLLTVASALYYWSVFGNSVWAPPLLGVCLAMMGLAIQHDANHGAFSSSTAINRIAGFADDVIGGSALCWRHQHVVAHHADPNDVMLDPDSYNNFPIIRFNPALPCQWYHAFQPLYAPIMYSLIGMSYVVGDFFAVFGNAYAHIPMHRLRAIDWIQFFAGKVVHLGIFYALPLWVGGVESIWRQILPMQLVGSLFLASTFAVSHNTEGALYNPREDMDWGEMQVRTSVNWSVQDDPETSYFMARLWLYVSGGLNYQIEHHLFPSVCHMHYPAISRIVRSVCAERGIPYNTWGSFTAITRSHYRVLSLLGQGEDDAVYASQPRRLGPPHEVETVEEQEARRVPGEVDPSPKRAPRQRRGSTKKSQ